MAERYLASGKLQHEPDEKDIQYARAFNLVANLLDAADHSEDIALRLSTCRNAFLTLNAVFVTLKRALGRGSRPSPAARAIYDLKRNEPAVALRSLEELPELVASVEQKWKVWAERERLDGELEALIVSPKIGLPDYEQAMLRKIFRETPLAEQSSDEAARSCNPIYLKLSIDEPAYLAGTFELLRGASRGIEAVMRVARAIAEYMLTAPEVMDASYLPGVTESVDRERRAAAWAAAYDAVLAAAATLQLQVESDSIRLRFPADRRLLFSRTPSLADNLKLVIEGLLAHLEEMVTAMHRDLRELRPNRGNAPMPLTFEIDLSQPESPRTNYLTCQFEVVSLARQPTERVVKVAVADFAWPFTAYTGINTFRLADAHLREIENLLEEAVRRAVAKGVQAIVFPEYFVPERCMKKLAKQAAEAGLIFIGGQEGVRPLSNHHLENIAYVAGPGLLTPKKQYKHYPSVEEPSADFRSERRQYVFTDTPIGTFTVLICSDAFEHHVVHAVANADPMLDILFVCGFSPNYPELFEHLAIADATRLFAHVVVANNGSGEKETSVAGSGVYRPERTKTSRAMTPAEIVPLDMQSPFDSDEAKSEKKSAPALRIYHLDIGAVRESRELEKPRPGLFAPPNFRRKFVPRGSSNGAGAG